MAALTTHVASRQGLRFDNLLVAATSGGDDCQAGAGIALVVKNADSVGHTVTMVTPQIIDGDLPVPDRQIVVPAGAMDLIEVPDEYRDPDTGRASITYDAVTSMTIAVIRVTTS